MTRHPLQEASCPSEYSQCKPWLMGVPISCGLLRHVLALTEGEAKTPAWKGAV